MDTMPDPIRDFVQNKIRQVAATRRQLVPNIADNFNLVESGLFDSLGFVDLISAIEKNFDLIFDPGDSGPEELAILGNFILAAHSSARLIDDVQAPHIVPMRPYGDLLPLFCTHCGTGNVLRYRALVSFLDSDIPIYGVRAPELRAMNPFPTVEALANLYLDEIQKIQPRGPYQLFGFCIGGAVAFEVARQLAEMGETVSPLVLVDTLNTAYYRKAPLIRSLRFQLRHDMADWPSTVADSSEANGKGSIRAFEI